MLRDRDKPRVGYDNNDPWYVGRGTCLYHRGQLRYGECLDLRGDPQKFTYFPTLKKNRMAKLRAESVLGIHRELADNTELWDGDGQIASLRRYCFRHGVTHILMAGEPKRAETLLTDFAYCMARLDMEGATGARPMTRDYRTTQSMGGLREPEDFQVWEDFFDASSYILCRGTKEWPAKKILLQLATEHADGSLVTKTAERWVQENGCNWPHLINLRRPPSVRENDIKDVHLNPLVKRGMDHEGHGGRIAGAIPISTGKVISWALDGTLKIWDTTNGTPVHTLKAHGERIIGVKEISREYLASWGCDQCLRIYRQDDYVLKWDHQFTGAFIEKVEVLPSNRIAILLSDAQVCFLSFDDFILQFAGAHEMPISLSLTSDDKLITGSWGGEIKVWDSVSANEIASSEFHNCSISHIVVLQNGELLSASIDGYISSWNHTSREVPKILAKLEGKPTQLLTGSNGNIVASCRKGEIQLFNHSGLIKKWNLGRIINDLCVVSESGADQVCALVDNREVLKLEPSTEAFVSSFEYEVSILCIGIVEGSLMACLSNGNVVDVEMGKLNCNLTDFTLPLESSVDGKVLGTDQIIKRRGESPVPAFILNFLSQTDLQFVSPFAHSYSSRPSIALSGGDKGEYIAWHHVRPITPLFAMEENLLACELNDRIVFLKLVFDNLEEASA